MKNGVVEELYALAYEFDDDIVEQLASNFEANGKTKPIEDYADDIYDEDPDEAEALWDAIAALRQTESRHSSKAVREDFEFYRDSNGKVGVDKVITAASKSGKTFKDGSDNGGDTSQAVKRIPFSKMSQDDKELARAAYKTLKQNGSISDVDKKFKTSPEPDVVMKGDGTHADIYYDDNDDGEPDEKDVRLAASRRRTSYQKSHGLKEDVEDYADDATDQFFGVIKLAYSKGYSKEETVKILLDSISQQGIDIPLEIRDSITKLVDEGYALCDAGEESIRESQKKTKRV